MKKKKERRESTREKNDIVQVVRKVLTNIVIVATKVVRVRSLQTQGQENMRKKERKNKKKQNGSHIFTFD